MSRRHWREVRRFLRRNRVAWGMKDLRGVDIRKHRNAWRRNGKTAAEWFPVGRYPSAVLNMPEWVR